MGLDWIGLDGWLSYTAVTPRASLKSDANNLFEQFEFIKVFIEVAAHLPMKNLIKAS